MKTNLERETGFTHCRYTGWKKGRIMIMKKPFLLTAFILTAIFTFCTAETVWSHGKGEQRIEEQYYDTWEANYLGEVKQLLVRHGLEHSGITMTKVKGSDGSRSYEVAIHHRRTASMTQEQQETLIEALDTLSFPVRSCQFHHYLTA